MNNNVIKGAVGTADFLHKFHTAPMVVYLISWGSRKGVIRGIYPP